MFCIWVSEDFVFTAIFEPVRTFCEQSHILLHIPSQGLKIRGARNTLVGIICPHGWDRANCSAKAPLALPLATALNYFPNFLTMEVTKLLNGDRHSFLVLNCWTSIGLSQFQTNKTFWLFIVKSQGENKNQNVKL